MRTLVSKKLPGIGLVAVELEIGRQPPAKGAQPLQEILAAGFASDGERALASDMHFDLVAWLEPERFDNGGGKADGQAIAPFGDLHHALRRIDICETVYPLRTAVNKIPPPASEAEPPLRMPHATRASGSEARR